jgi:hypothetical protein
MDICVVIRDTHYTSLPLKKFLPIYGENFHRNIVLLLVLFAIKSKSSLTFNLSSISFLGWLVIVFTNSGKDFIETAGEVFVLAYSTREPL